MTPPTAADRRRRNEPLPPELVRPHRARLDPRHPDAPTIEAVHARAVADGADGYIDPTSGMFCFTAAYHWDKGECCDLGCRHCPWLDADGRLGAPG